MKLSYKIAGIIGSFSLLAMVAAVLFCYLTVSDTIRARIMVEQRESVTENLDKIDRYLHERQDEIRDTALGEQFRVYLQGNHTVDPVALLQKESDDDDWDGFALIDLKGQTVASTKKSDLGSVFLGLNASFPALYAQAKSGQEPVDHSAVIHLSDGADPSLVMFTPVYDEKSRPIGVLAGETSWDAIIEILKRIEASDVTLTTRDGIEIGTNQDDKKSRVLKADWSGRPLFAKARSAADGSALTGGLDDPNETVLASYAAEPGYRDYAGNGWHLLATTPAAAAFAPARAIATQLALILAGVFLLMLGLITYFMTRHVSRPLQILNTAVRKLSGGGWGQQLAVTSRDEIGELAAAFNTMSSQIAISHHQLSLEKARLEASIQGLPLGFILTDKRNNIVNINPVMRKLLGLKINKTNPALKRTKQLELLQDILARCQDCLESGKVSRVAESLIGNRYYRFFVAPVLAGNEAIGAVVLLEDITEAKVAERSKDEFFSIASHELRTPLTAIRGNTAMIQQYYPEQLKDPALHDIVGDIHDSSLRLIEIVNDFLDTTRLEQGKMKFKLEAFAIDTVIEHVIYELDGVGRERHVYLRMTNGLGSLPLVYADKDRIKQVVYNLIGNALKFVATGGVTISATADKHHLKVLVADTGQGISPENQQLLFHKFQQATTSILTRDDTRGTGLGLYISKLLLEQMGGSIALEHSEVGQGSVFSFTVPLAAGKK